MKRATVTLFFSLLISLLFAQNPILIVSWNIRDFGKSKSPEEIERIADIVKAYDVVALQEVVAGPGGSQAVAYLADILNRKGTKWDYRISDPTRSPKYKTEKYAFLWKTNKVQLIGRPTLVKEVAAKVFREPYKATFKFNGRETTILNYHSRRFDETPEIEVAALAQYLSNQNSRNWLLLGDFNLSANSMAFNAFKILGFDALLENQKTTLKKQCTTESIYLYHDIDNIFLNRQYFTVLNCGIIDFVNGCENLTAARFISDHVPVYVELDWKE